MRVVAIIAIGAFAVGAVLGGKEFIQKDLARTWIASNPATIGLSVKPAVNKTTLNALENIRGVDTVEGWQQETVKWRPSPSHPWEPAILVALEDYADQPIRQVKLDEGDWPSRKMMGVQRGRELRVGDGVLLEINDKAHNVELNGVLYNAAHPPPFIESRPMFFTTPERFKQLTGESNYSQVLATIPDYSDERVEAAADLIQHDLEKQGVEVTPAIPAPGGFTTRTSNPARFIAQDVLDGVFLLLTVMAVATLLLGLFLVYNTIDAIISQQVDQIGIMKAIGAKLARIVLIYFTIVLIYALLALLIAVPLGALGAHGLRLAMIGRIQMTPGAFEISTTAVRFQVAVALLSPLVIAIIPILSGARVTVREAISTYGLSGSSSLIDRMLTKLQFIPRIVSLTLSNTFRNKKRVLLTQVTLIGAGVIFMMVMNTQNSLLYTFTDVIFNIFDSNVMLDLNDSERIEKIEELSLSVPNVKGVEVWGTAKGKARLKGQPESNNDSDVKLRGLPVPTTVYRPIVSAGRWLQLDDGYAVVLNQELAAEMDVGLGDWITVDIPAKRESHWQVVGLVFEPLEQASAMMPRDTLLKEIREVDRGKAIKVQTRRTDAASEAATSNTLRSMYEGNGYNVVASTADTAHRLTEQRVEQMSILVALLSAMAAMMSLVGMVALSGTLSINVLERTREIGVMRAIGASNLVVAGQFVGEGLILGWLSWLIAIPVSLPVGYGVIKMLSQLVNIELIYKPSAEGFVYWLVIVTVLAFIASWFPAQKAAQTSVRESLSYA